MADERFERKDISLTPNFPWIVFGDGYFAQVIEIVASKNTEGDDVYKMRILPTQELIKKYNITTDMFDESLTVSVEYSQEYVKVLSRDPSNSVYFCFLNFNGMETDATSYWKGYLDAEKVLGLKRRIELLKAENAYYRERYERAVSNIRETIKTDIQGPASELSASILAQQMSQNQSPVRGGNI